MGNPRPYEQLTHTDLSAKEVERIGLGALTVYLAENAYRTQEEVKNTAVSAHRELEALFSVRPDLYDASAMEKMRAHVRLTAESSEMLYNRISRLCNAIEEKLAKGQLHSDATPAFTEDTRDVSRDGARQAREKKRKKKKKRKSNDAENATGQKKQLSSTHVQSVEDINVLQNDKATAAETIDSAKLKKLRKRIKKNKRCASAGDQSETVPDAKSLPAALQARVTPDPRDASVNEQSAMRQDQNDVELATSPVTSAINDNDKEKSASPRSASLSPPNVPQKRSSEAMDDDDGNEEVDNLAKLARQSTKPTSTPSIASSHANPPSPVVKTANTMDAPAVSTPKAILKTPTMTSRKKAIHTFSADKLERARERARQEKKKSRMSDVMSKPATLV